MSYSSKPADPMLCVGTTWFRASRVESIKIKAQDEAGPRDVFVKMFSGEELEFRMKAKDANLLPAQVMGR